MKKILVVEDDRDIRKNMKLLLESEGYEVLLAENGRLALDYLEGASLLPDAIILDLTMPVMDGFEFREAQLNDARLASIPVGIMTADGRVDEKRLRVRAAEGLRKPAALDDILEMAERLCGAALSTSG
jgi:CheY-like chemotaxis protein